MSPLHRPVPWWPLALVLVLLAGLWGPSVQGQSRFQTQQAFVASPEVLGMGGAGVALPRTASVFFYNPAHLTRVDRQVVLFGLQGQASTDVGRQVRFVADRLEPALDRGLETLSDDELDALYAEALELGYEPTTLNGTALLPAVVWPAGPVGVGGGLFSYTDLTYRFGDAGLRVPRVDLVGRTDAMARAAVAVELGPFGLPGLTVGLTGTLTRRYLTFKDKPLDAIDSGEEVLLLRGTALGLDAGLLYDVPVQFGPGTLHLGAAAYDFQTTGFDYVFHGTPQDVPLIGGVIDIEGDPPSSERIEREREAANERFGLSTWYRIGAAYRMQGLGALPKAAVAVDYRWTEDLPVDRSFFAGLHLGASVQPVPGIALRAGLNQGYPTAGVGVELGAVHVDYAFHGVEHGRYPGQMPGYQHTVQLLFGLF